MPGLIEQADNTHIGLFNSIEVPMLRMTEGAEIGNYNIIKGNGKVVLGRNAVIADYCSILTTTRSAYGMMGEHCPQEFTDPTDADIYIMDDAYVGAYSIICPGVRIGEGAVIGAYSFIMKDVAPNTIIRFKSKRLESERKWYHHRSYEGKK